ncbi:MAG TPA: rubrerythrin family protein [Candidatus Methanoperedens sp.]|nr:rubrerythrin family protein [Candidatus Methanoperedens sp.]
MGKTEQHLTDAFAGESQANRKYLAFAAQADTDGHPAVARLFRAAALAETVHAHAHLRVLGGIRDTAANLREAIGGETHEFERMYPQMIADAEAEGNAAAARSFRFANAVEKVHAALYRQALAELGRNADAVYWVCGVCGNTVAGEPPDTCPICGAKRAAFAKVD